MFRSGVVVLILVLATPALGKASRGKGKKPEEPLTIEMCGLASFDAVFARVAAIDEKLTHARGLLGEAKQDLNTALGVGRGSIQEGLADLKAQAGDHLTVKMVGGVPRVTAKAAAPANVLAAVDAVNGLVDGITGTIVELKAIPTEAAALVTETAKLPGRLKSEAKAAGLKPTEIPGKLKIIKQDMEVAAALPEKAASVVERMTGLITAVGALAPVPAR